MTGPPDLPDAGLPREPAERPERSGWRIAAGVVLGLAVLPLALVAVGLLQSPVGGVLVVGAFLLVVVLNNERGFALGAGIGCAVALLIGGGACIYLINQFNA